MIENYVTGASGFIGQHLVPKLQGETKCLNFNQLSVLGNSNKFFFLSTYGNMAHHSNHYEMIQANVLDLVRVMTYPKWLMFMSSSSVLLPVQTPYSRTKRAAEEILQALPELKSCIVRPYSVTGVGEQKEHLIPTLIRSCMEGEEMPFDPNPVHDFIDVEDVVNALVTLADKQMIGIVELGSGIPHSNQEVLELVEHFCQKKANIQSHHGLRAYDNEEWYCRNSWWTTRKPLAKSIEEMVEAYRREHC